MRLVRALAPKMAEKVRGWGWGWAAGGSRWTGAGGAGWSSSRTPVARHKGGRRAACRCRALCLLRPAGFRRPTLPRARLPPQGKGIIICIGDVEGWHTGPKHAAYGKSARCQEAGSRSSYLATGALPLAGRLLAAGVQLHNRPSGAQTAARMPPYAASGVQVCAEGLLRQLLRGAARPGRARHVHQRRQRGGHRDGRRRQAGCGGGEGGRRTGGWVGRGMGGGTGRRRWRDMHSQQGGSSSLGLAGCSA